MTTRIAPLLFVFVLLRFSSTAVLAQLQHPVPQEKMPAATSIPGVVEAGSPMNLIWVTNDGADGIVGTADGSLLVASRKANAVIKIDAADKASVYLDDTNEGGSLTIDYKGRVIAVERGNPQRVRILTAPRKILNQGLGGKPLVGLRDLTVDKKNGVYFTDGEGRTSTVYYVKPDGHTTIKVIEDLAGANGVILSPDEKTMYIADTPNEYLLVYDVRPDGTVTNRRNFAHLDGPKHNGADGLGIDGAGRLYVATPIGVQVFSAKGEYLGSIPTPRGTTSLAFAGPGKKTLYIVGRGHAGPDGNGDQSRSLYRLQMIAQGYKGRPK
jgi:sugar lactone lactonase YvrE